MPKPACVPFKDWPPWEPTEKIGLTPSLPHQMLATVRTSERHNVELYLKVELLKGDEERTDVWLRNTYMGREPRGASGFQVPIQGLKGFIAALQDVHAALLRHGLLNEDCDRDGIGCDEGGGVRDAVA